MREHNLLSGYMLAKKMGVGKQTVYDWLNKKSTFSDENALKCAQLLPLNPAYVVVCSRWEKAQTDEAREFWQTLAQNLPPEKAA